MKRPTMLLPSILLCSSFIFLIAGTYNGLFIAPAEQHMGEVQRIMYVHVPTAWTAMLVLTWAFLSAVMFLIGASYRWDNRLEAALGVSVVFCLLLCIQGTIWAKPTWGVWWDWDPRLTTTAVLVFAFGGILALRAFVDDPARRAVWSAVACVIAFADVPIVYFSVKWWNSLHQSQSSPETVSKAFHWPLRINAFGILFLWTGLVAFRARLAALRLHGEIDVQPPAKLPATSLPRPKGVW